MAHLPVLYNEVMSALQPHPGGRYLDATVGGGGHSRGILAASAPGGRLLGTDADADAISAASVALAEFGSRAVLRQCWIDEAPAMAQAEGFTPLDGVLVDLGLSSNQLDDPQRGLSFMREGPLDMRFDRSKGLTAAEIIDASSVDDLRVILRDYGEVPDARRVAEAIWAARPIRTTAELRTVVEKTHHHHNRRHERHLSGARSARIHPATQVFQAFRIAVNDELRRLADALPRLIDSLAGGGRMAVISFHSLEDRIVKLAFREASNSLQAQPGFGDPSAAPPVRVRLLTKKPIEPSETEAAANPRARSAKLRVVEKLHGV